MAGDRISEAYNGELDPIMKKNSRIRVDWICDQVDGDDILDVGCSQGITSILLGRRGKNILAIDNDSNSIEYAKTELEKEKESIQENVEFIYADFLEYEFKDKLFDTIIMGEVLEHILDPSSFLCKASTILKSTGKIIITVPFGINPHPDHKHTYYFLQMYKLINEKFCVNHVKFMTGWIAFTAELKNNNKKDAIVIDELILSRIEDAFYKLDYQKLEQKNKLVSAYNFIDKLKEERKEIIENNKKNNKLNNELNSELSSKAQLMKENERKYNRRIEYLEKEYNEKINILKEEKKSIEKDNNIYKRKLNESNKNIRKLEKKYEIISTSKLGKIQIEYWKLKNSIKRKIKNTKNKIKQIAKKSSFLCKLVWKYRLRKSNDKIKSNISLNNNIKNKNIEGNIQSNPKLAKLNAAQRRQAFEESADTKFLETIKNYIEKIPESNGCKYYEKHQYRIGIIADEFLYNAFKDAADFIFLNPNTWEDDIENIDFLLVASAWKGINEEWRGAANEKSEKRKLIYTIIDECKKLNKKTVFYSKEDPPNYDNFIGIAKKCEYIFTTCAEVVDNYKKDCNNNNVYVLCFGINPIYHNPIGFHNKGKKDGVIFSGSWMIKYPERQKDMRMLFDGVIESNKPLKIIDRNYFYTQSENYRYPGEYWNYISPAIDHEILQKVHKLYDWSININTVTDSMTMFANRTYELQAAGNLIISNYSPGVNSKLPMVFTVVDKSEISAIINSYDKERLYERQIEGIRSVMTGETAFDRVGELIKEIGLEPQENDKSILVVCKKVTSAIQEMFNNQSYEHKKLISIDAFNQEILDKFDMVAFWDETMEYGIFYLEDMSNAFKYTACDYITKDGYYDGDNYINGKEHGYVDLIKNKYRTLFYSKSYTAEQLINIDGEVPMTNGYSIDHFNYNVKKVCREKKDSYKLSVIIACYNNGKNLLGKAFSSLTRSSMFNEMEILLVDDGSTDNYTDKVIKNLEESYSNVIAYFFNDGGSGSASRPRNKGTELATSKYITYLDPDNEAVFDGYYKLYNEAIKGDYDLVVGNMLKLTTGIFDAQYYKNFSEKYGKDLVIGDKKQFIKKTKFSPMSIQAMVIEKSLIESSGISQVVGAAGEDTLFCWELCLNAKCIKAIDVPIHIYYAAVEGSTVNSISKNFFKKYYLIEKPRRESLEKHKLLNEYMQLRYSYYFCNWILRKLSMVKEEDVEECVKIVYEMHKVYEDVYLGDDSLINKFMKKCEQEQYQEAFNLIK